MDKDRISGAAREAAGTVEQLYGQAKDTMHEIGDAASSYAKDAVDAGTDLYRDSHRAAAAAIRHQPLGALLAAGAAGFLLALMISRQPQRRFPRRWR
ncbi:MAG: hypothetical protein J0G37_12065 [Afipia sp.]|nr:hypothetical protein [Afipia sp.]